MGVLLGHTVAGRGCMHGTQSSELKKLFNITMKIYKDNLW